MEVTGVPWFIAPTPVKPLPTVRAEFKTMPNEPKAALLVASANAARVTEPLAAVPDADADWTIGVVRAASTLPVETVHVAPMWPTPAVVKVIAPVDGLALDPYHRDRTRLEATLNASEFQVIPLPVGVSI